MSGVAESIIIEAVGWVASPLVATLLDEGLASLGINAEKKLRKLRDTVLPVLKSVIEKAEGSPHRSEVEGWLQRLKDAYEDAEDDLDLLNYDRLRWEVAAANGKRQTHWVPKGGRDVLSPRKIKLKRRLNKLEKIAGEAEKLRTLLGAQPETAAAPDSRQTISVPPPKVFGRDEDREEIIRRLKMEPTAAGIPIIGIVGRPGIGKTTLAQYVHKQLEDEGDRHFDPIMWVYASRNFTASKIMKKIIQQASIASESEDRALNTVDTLVAGNLDSAEELRRKMKIKLNGKKFLLVIDDVWCDGEDHKKNRDDALCKGEHHENNWDTLIRCLSECILPGCKILVTSQADDAPEKIAHAKGAAVEYIRHMKDLAENDFAELFIHHALPSGEIDSRVREEIEEKCKAIAKRLSKDPTVAKMVGKTIATKVVNVLHSHSQGNLHAYLDRIAEKDWSGDRTKALMWSYQHLPAHLQRCFSYCSLCPRGFKFEALELVQLWMAQGFIKPDDPNERMEDVGDQYLNELVSRFYIQCHDRVRHSSGTGNLDSYYTLHELLFDLAAKVARSDCVRIEGNHQGEIPSTIRHLCIPADKLNENRDEICELTKLRTLIVTKGKGVVSDENVATEIFKSLKKLRVLLVLGLNLEISAKSTGEMKHLRILRVLGTCKFVLPESLSTLYQLQVLEVGTAGPLPTGVNNLVGLRYLRPYVMADIGKFTSLQRLEEFRVRKEKGYELEQLQNLNELRGRLCIDNLENVVRKESAVAANLKEKKHLDTLHLVWRGGKANVSANLDVEILEGLQLPPYVTSLHLDGYRGRSWPENHQASKIEELALKRCGMLEELPPMHQLYPSCTSLELSDLSRLKALHTLPRSLRKFKISQTPLLIFVTKEDLQMSPGDKRSIREVMRNRAREWFPRQHEWSFGSSERGMREFIAAMSDSNNEASSPKHNSSPAAEVDIIAVGERWLEMHERKMELIYNRQHEAKLLLPSTLTELSLEGCIITDRALSACLQALTSLTRLSLERVITVTCLPSKDVLCKLEVFQYLRLVECRALTSLGGIESLPCLKFLFLAGCPCLDSETAFLPSSLRSLLFESCPDVDDILAKAQLPHLSELMISQCHMRMASLQFGNLPSLHSLQIMYCPGLSSLVDIQELHSLESLILLNCRNLQSVMNFPISLKSLKIEGCPVRRNPKTPTPTRACVRHLSRRLL